MINLFLVHFNLIGDDTGVATYIDSLLAELLVKKDLQLHLILINSSLQGEYGVTTDAGYKCYHFPVPQKYPHTDDAAGQIAYYKGVVSILDKIVQGLPNVIFHFNWINHHYFAKTLKERLKCKILLTTHCISWKSRILRKPDDFIKLSNAMSNAAQPFQLPADLIDEKIGYSHFDHFITVTETGKDNLTRIFKVLPKKISVIYNGIKSDTTALNNRNKHELKKKYGFEPTTKIILFVGRKEKTSGFLTYVPVLKKIIEKYNGKVKLLLVGHLNYSKVVSEFTPLWPHIVYTGFVPRTTLKDFYLMADIGLIPSLYEQCSYVALEMMKYCLPIIASKIDGLEELLTDEDNGILIPLAVTKGRIRIDSDKLERSVHSLLSNTPYCKKIIRASRITFEKRFEVSKMIKKTLDVYHALLLDSESQKIDG